MGKRSLILLGFGVVVAAQLAVPASMIIGRERTLREGQVFKFRTQPVDPADAFRGRYVLLRLEPGVVEVPRAEEWPYRRKAFAVLGTDTNGFAVVTRLERKQPAGEPAARVRTLWHERNDRLHINWIGLDRYYMTEEKAPAAEAAYWSHNTRTNRACHVAVRVRGGDAVIEDLFIDDQPIRDWLREH